MVTIDATGLVLGRMSTYIAKRLLSGEQVNVINCEKAVVSGSKSKVERLKKLRDMGGPFHGPFYPKRADRVVKRTIRGMLPYKQARGRDAFSRVRCYLGQPDGIAMKNFISIPEASGDKIAAIKTITIKQLVEHI